MIRFNGYYELSVRDILSKIYTGIKFMDQNLFLSKLPEYWKMAVEQNFLLIALRTRRKNHCMVSLNHFNKQMSH